MAERLDKYTAFVVRSTVQETASNAAHVAKLSAELREHLERGESKLAGQTAGEMVRWALLLIDAGADPHDVRTLIKVAARAAQTSERAA